jgi:hypothetical protein
VSVQQRDFGEPLDDVIVDFEDAAKNPARLSLQVKRSLTINKAKTNADFRDIILDSWATWKTASKFFHFYNKECLNFPVAIYYHVDINTYINFMTGKLSAE